MAKFADLEGFKKVLSEGTYETSTFALRAVGKTQTLSDADKEVARGLVREHFGIAATEAATATKKTGRVPKAKTEQAEAPAATAAAPTGSRVPRKPRAKKTPEQVSLPLPANSATPAVAELRQSTVVTAPAPQPQTIEQLGHLDQLQALAYAGGAMEHAASVLRTTEDLEIAQGASEKRNAILCGILDGAQATINRTNAIVARLAGGQ